MFIMVRRFYEGTWFRYIRVQTAYKTMLLLEPLTGEAPDWYGT
jgi:hypothetical protein